MEKLLSYVYLAICGVKNELKRLDDDHEKEARNETKKTKAPFPNHYQAYDLLISSLIITLFIFSFAYSSPGFLYL